MDNSTSPAIEIREVSGKKMLKTFIRIPWTIYKDDPNWVPLLMMERMDAFSPKHPYFKHAKWQAWVAYVDGKPVGRISAQVDELHLEHNNDSTGFFGLIEAPDDDAVFKALLDTAANWLKNQGMSRIAGPFNLSINHYVGVLVEGFDTPPYVMTGHTPPYYAASIERQGYQAAQDLLAYQLDSGTLTIPRVMQSLLQRSSKRISSRNLDRNNKGAELEVLRDIFNDAWQDNWCFSPFTREEFEVVGKELLMVVPKDFIQIAQIDGEDAAFIVLLPNLNEVFAELDGRLLPLGWAKLLWRLKVNFPKSARVPLMGVRKKFQNTRFGPALAYMTIKGVIDAGTAKGLERIEMSWILEHNHGVRNIIESVGGEIAKRYRIYQKDL